MVTGSAGRTFGFRTQNRALSFLGAPGIFISTLTAAEPGVGVSVNAGIAGQSACGWVERCSRGAISIHINPGHEAWCQEYLQGQRHSPLLLTRQRGSRSLGPPQS